MPRTTVDVVSLIGAVVDLDCFTDGSDAVGMESNRGAVECFDPVYLAAFFAVFGGDAVGSVGDGGAERGEFVGGSMSDVESEEDVTWDCVYASW